MLQALTLVLFCQRLDPSRLVNPASGWYDAPVGDVIDVHDYVEVRSPRPTWTRAAVLGEYGGLGHKASAIPALSILCSCMAGARL